MKKLLTAAVALSFLTGCGAHGLTSANAATASMLAAQSKEAAEKAVRAMFKAAFKAADKNGDGKLTLDEMPGALPVATVPGAAPSNLPADAKALFAQLDTKKKGYVTYRDFCAGANVQQVTNMFRTQAELSFAALDVNGDHLLTATELKGSPFEKMTFSMDKKGNITPSAFENGVAASLAAGADPVTPPGPVNPPAPPAPAAPTAAPSSEPAPADGPPNPPAPPAPAAQ